MAITMNYTTGSANAYPNAMQLAGQANGPVPRSISSALSRMDVVSERLGKVREHLNALADQIGGPRPADGQSLNSQPGLPAGAVHRLNDSADRANDIIGDIESLLDSISRALG